MTANILLIWVPVLSALLIATTILYLLNGWFENMGRARTWLISLLVSACALFCGALLGLLASIQINRVAFDYQVLSEALGPNGILVWYGFGPAFTPQFSAYWQYTTLLLLVALPIQVYSRTYFATRVAQRI